MSDWQNPSAGDLGSYTLGELQQEPTAKRRRRAQATARASGEGGRQSHDWTRPSAGELVEHEVSSGTATASWQRPTPGELRDSQTGAEGASNQDQKRGIELALSTLMLLQGHKHEADLRRSTVYSRNAIDPVRIRKVLQAGCTCKCQCRKSVSHDEVLAFCTAFHSCTPDAQTHLLHSAYNTASGTESPPPGDDDRAAIRTEWYLNGKHVSVPCLSAMLGVGLGALYKACHGHFDGRLKSMAPRRQAPHAHA